MKGRKGKQLLSWLLSMIMVLSMFAGIPATAVTAATVTSLKEGTDYIIVSKKSGKALTVESYVKAQDARICQLPIENYESQVFTLRLFEDGYYQFVNKYSNKALDVPGKSTDAGKGIVQFGKGSEDNQKLKITDQGNGYFRISPKLNENLAFSMKDASVEDWGILIQDTYTGGDHQLWEFREVTDVKPNPIWEEPKAKLAMDTYLDTFYYQKDGVALLRHQLPGAFWTDAEIFEVFLDAYEQLGDEKYLEISKEFYDSIIKRRKDDWSWNGYNDDVMWMVIGSARLHFITGEQKYLDIAIKNFNMAYNRGWSEDLGGGLWWHNDTKESKNACANSPAMIAACLIGEATGDEAYYDKAEKIFDWIYENLYVEENGGVRDNIDINEKYNNWVSCGNQGVFIGGSTLLYKHTGNEKHYNAAKKAADRAVMLGIGEEGYLNKETDNSDSVAAKGILARWMRIFAQTFNDTDYNDWMERNAKAAWNNRNKDNLMWAAFGQKTVENLLECTEVFEEGRPDVTVEAFAAWGCSAAVSWLVNSYKLPTEDESTSGYRKVPMECESMLLEGSAKAQEGDSVSNGQYVANVGGDKNGTATCYVNVKNASTRVLRIYYASASKRSVRVIVNGGEPVDLRCIESGGWTVTAAIPLSVEINLKKGDNSIQLAGIPGEPAPNLDWISIELTDTETIGIEPGNGSTGSDSTEDDKLTEDESTESTDPGLNGNKIDIGNSSSDWELKSPDDNTVIAIRLKNNKLRYNVKQKGNTIVEESDMGINTSKGDFTNGLTFKSASAQVVCEKYQNLSGIRKISTNYCHEATLTFEKGEEEFQVIARAYNDGIAFRYKVNSSGIINIEPDQETTSFRIPNNSPVWYMNYYGKTGSFVYENQYEQINVNDLKADSKIIPSMPMTYQVGNQYALIAEADKNGSYVGSFLQPEGECVLRMIFDKKQTKAVETTAPFQTPWRTVIIGDLNAIATNSMLENLSPAPDEQYNFKEWVQPGVSAWSWVDNWGKEGSDQSLKETHMKWIDLASKMGWKYYIMDEGWQPKVKANGSTYEGYHDWFEEVRDYAEEKGVSLIAWVCRTDMDNVAKREARLKAWSEAGIKGIKVDFFFNEDQRTLKLHEEIYKDAAKYKMLVNVHGSNPPSGERRTYPNVISREAIAGQEQGALNPEQFALIPFTRAAVGTADVTEELYSKNAGTTTMGFQIALSVLIENGIRSLGGKPVDYLQMPEAISYYKNFPEKWDESQLLDSAIGKYVNIARKAGEGWYVAGITVEEKELSLKMDFLEEGVNYTAILYKEKYDKERQAIETEVKKNIIKDSTLDISLLHGGGYAIKLFPQNNGLIKSAKAFPSTVKMAVKNTKDIEVLLKPSNTSMIDFEWKVEDPTIASIESTSTSATVTGLREGNTRIIGTSVFDEAIQVAVKVEVTTDSYPIADTWKIMNDNHKYKVMDETSLRITAERGIIENNVFAMNIPNNEDKFSIEAKISGGLADNFQGGFIGVFKESLGNNFVGVGRRFHTLKKINNDPHLFAMMSSSTEEYAADMEMDKDAYVKLEKDGNKYIGYYKRNEGDSWSKISEVTKNNLADSNDLRIGVYTGCGGGYTNVDITFTDFKFNDEVIKFATENTTASREEVYTVEFDTANGKVMEPQFLTAGQKVSKPADPKNGEYPFLGWYVGGKEYDFNSEVTRDLLITAKWEGIVEKPDIPSTPEGPQKPDTPSVPSKPQNPDAPDESSESQSPNVPNESSESQSPNAPDVPSEPIESTTPSAPSSPLEPLAPSEPDTSQNSDTPNNPQNQPDNSVKVQRIALQGKYTRIAAGKKMKLTATVEPGNATNPNVIFTSSEPRYASVSKDGKVTTYKEGKNRTVIITATAADGSGIKTIYSIKIMEKAVKKIDLKAASSVQAGKKRKIKAIVMPKASSKKVNAKLTWTSSNKKYATVNGQGVVKAKKAGKGKSVKITARATDGTNKKATIRIWIK